MGLAALDHFRAEAARCTPVPCRADLPVVLANVNTAFRAVAPRVGELSELLPKHDLRPMLEMPNIAQALAYAGNRVAAAASSADAAALLRDQLWAMLLERDVKLRVVAAVLFEGKAATIVPPLQSRAAMASAASPATAEGEKPAEPVVTDPVVSKPAEPVVIEPVAAKPVTPGNSTPPAPMRPKSAQAREPRASARRKR